MIIPSPRKGEDRPAERVKMTWCPRSNVVGLDSLKFLHVACGVENRPGSDSVEFDGNGGKITLVLALDSVRRDEFGANGDGGAEAQ